MRELRSLLPFLRPYLRTYALGLVLVVISNFFATLGPRFLEDEITAYLWEMRKAQRSQPPKKPPAK